MLQLCCKITQFPVFLLTLHRRFMMVYEGEQFLAQQSSASQSFLSQEKCPLKQSSGIAPLATTIIGEYNYGVQENRRNVLYQDGQG